MFLASFFLYMHDVSVQRSSFHCSPIHTVRCFPNLHGWQCVKDKSCYLPIVNIHLRFQNRLLEMGVMLFGQINFLVFIFWMVSHEAFLIYILD